MNKHLLILNKLLNNLNLYLYNFKNFNKKIKCKVNFFYYLIIND